VAKTFGATQIINSATVNVAEKVMALTNGRGVDTAIEAVGLPATFELCQSIISAGGHIANIGVHGKPVTLHLETLWSRNISITTRLVDTVTTPMLFKTVQSRKIEPKKLITHRFKLDQMIEAYDTFEHAAKEKALKVILEN
jgi:alcohol dehydrogenase